MCSRAQPRVLRAAARVKGCSSACRSVACAPQPAAAAFALMRCSISSSAAVACTCVSGAAPRRRLDPLGEMAARRRNGQDGALPPLSRARGMAAAGSQRSEEEGSSWRWCCMKSGSTQAMSMVGTRRAVSAAVAAIAVAVAALGAALACDSLGWRWRSSSCSVERSSLVCQRVSACTAAACRACTASVGCGNSSAASPRSGPPAAPPRRTCARTVRQLRGTAALCDMLQARAPSQHIATLLPVYHAVCVVRPCVCSPGRRGKPAPARADRAHSAHTCRGTE